MTQRTWTAMTMLAGLVLLPVRPIAAADWQKVTADDAGNVYSVDRDSVRKDHELVSAVVRNEYAEPRQDSQSGQVVYAVLDRLQVNCATASFALQTRTLVTADGTEIPSLAASREQLQFRVAPAGSLSESIVRSLCRAASGH